MYSQRITWFVQTLCTWCVGLFLVPAACLSAEVAEYLPAETQIVAYVNVKQLLASPLVKKHALTAINGLLAEAATPQTVLKNVGLDPMRDLHSLLLAAPASTETNRVLLVAKGNFDLAKITAKANELAKSDLALLKVHDEGKLRIYEGKMQDPPTPGFIAFPDKETMVISTDKAWLLVAANKQGKVPAELKQHLDKFEAKHSLWLVALPPKELKNALASNPQTENLAKSLQALTVKVVVSDTVDAHVVVYASDARSAETLRQLLNGVKGFAASAAAQNLPTYGQLLAEVLDTFKISHAQNTVVLTALIHDNLITKSLKKDK